MWIDDVIALQEEFFKAQLDETIDREIREAWVKQPDLFWTKEVELFCQKYRLDSLMGSTDRAIVGLIAADRFSLKDMKEFLFPRSLTKEKLTSLIEDQFGENGVPFYSKVYCQDGSIKYVPIREWDIEQIADLVMNSVQQLYETDRDVYKELCEQQLAQFKENISALLKYLVITDAQKNKVKEILTFKINI